MMEIKSTGKRLGSRKTHETTGLLGAVNSTINSKPEVLLFFNMDKREYDVYLNEDQAQTLINNLTRALDRARKEAALNARLDATRKQFQAEQEISA